VITKINLSIGDKTLTATLSDNETARDFASLLPFSISLRDYASTEKVGDPPRSLSTKGAPAGYTPKTGDIALYAPWGNISIFYKNYSYSEGLIYIGKIDSGLETLRGMNQNFTISFEAAQ
jgi:hypothetical protein